MSVSQELFRQAWGKFPTGVSIITTRREGGEPYCTTANAVVSVSLDPLLVLVSIASAGTTCANIRRDGRFGINILNEDQVESAAHYATGTMQQRQRLPQEHQVTPGGTAFLDEALACMDCRVVQENAAGDHTIFVGEVERVEVREGRPLVYYEGRFTSLAKDG